MTSIGMLIREAREGADLSMRALAKRADVAFSTVSRIESGEIDPTTGMLRGLMKAAGQQLEFTHEPSEGPDVGALADAWHPGTAGDRPDWTRLRAFLDFLAMHPEHTGPATLQMPPPSGSELLDNLLAGMTEKICDDAELPRPRWTKKVPPLSDSWVTPGTQRTQAVARAATPYQLSKRGITLAEESLWRDPANVGV